MKRNHVWVVERKRPRNKGWTFYEMSLSGTKKGAAFWMKMAKNKEKLRPSGDKYRLRKYTAEQSTGGS